VSCHTLGVLVVQLFVAYRDGTTEGDVLSGVVEGFSLSFDCPLAGGKGVWI